MEHTRSIFQQDFWIIRSRKHLKKTIRQCIPCRRLRQEPVKPLMADLPLQRLPLSENSYPFYSTGIDFFGLASRIVSPSPHNGQENLETSSSLESTVLEQIPQRLLANLDDPNEMDKASGKSSARRPCMDTGRPNASRSLAPGTGTSYFPRCRRNRSLLRN